MKKSWLVLFLLVVISFTFVSAGELKVTQEHPFLINGSWIDASQLKVGDELNLANGSKVTITKLTDVVSNKSFKVYNLEAGEYHNFVVGEEGVAVHNSDNLILPKEAQQINDNLINLIKEKVKAAQVVIQPSSSRIRTNVKLLSDDGQEIATADIFNFPLTVGSDAPLMIKVIGNPSKVRVGKLTIKVIDEFKGAGASGRLYSEAFKIWDNAAYVYEHLIWDNSVAFNKLLSQQISSGASMESALAYAAKNYPTGRNFVNRGYVLERVIYDTPSEPIVIWRPGNTPPLNVVE